MAPAKRKPTKRRRISALDSQPVNPFNSDDLEIPLADVLTHAQWDTMEPIGGFNITDEHVNLTVEFKRGSVARILPPIPRGEASLLELHQYWIGKILEIRYSTLDDGQTIVWTQVQWYYSAADVQAKDLKTFSSAPYGNFERLKSDECDFVSGLCFDGIASMTRFDEVSLTPHYIGPSSFYSRADFEVSRRAVLGKPRVTCLCKEPYNPDGPDAMHLCPRAFCGRWFHRGCLVNAGWLDTAPDPSPPPATNAKKPKSKPKSKTTGRKGKGRAAEEPDVAYYRADRLIVSHASNAALVLPADFSRRILGSPCVPLTSSALCTLALHPPDRAADLPDRAHSDEDWLRLPRSLVLLAAQPIVRGAAYGVAGNVHAVHAARGLVRGVLEGTVNVDALMESRDQGNDHDADDDENGAKGWWDDVFPANIRAEVRVDVEGWVQEMLADDGHKVGQVPALICPRCRGAI